jgi:hypothetical protein
MPRSPWTLRSSVDPRRPRRRKDIDRVNARRRALALRASVGRHQIFPHAREPTTKTVRASALSADASAFEEKKQLVREHGRQRNLLASSRLSQTGAVTVRDRSVISPKDWGGLLELSMSSLRLHLLPQGTWTRRGPPLHVLWRCNLVLVRAGSVPRFAIPPSPPHHFLRRPARRACRTSRRDQKRAAVGASPLRMSANDAVDGSSTGMAAIGTNRTSGDVRSAVAIEGKADVARIRQNRRD